MTGKRTHRFTSALLGTLLVPCHIFAQTAPAASLEEAQKIFSDKHYREAAQQAATFAQATPDPELRLTALLLQAKSLVNLSDFAAAEPVLDRYIYTKPRSSEALYLLGFVLQRENKPRESLAIYTRAAALAPPHPNDLKLVALDYVLLTDYPDAIVWLKRSVEGDPSNAEAWYFLGRSHMQVGDFVQAEKDFHRALAIVPQDSKALDNLGLALAAQNRNEEATHAYRDAIASQSTTRLPSEQPFLNLGTLLNDENRSGDALPLLQRCAQIAPDNVHCHEQVSRAYLATGNQPQAVLSMQRAVALDPSNPSLHFRLGQLYRKAGVKDKADAEIRLSVRLFGTHSTESPR